MNSRKSCYFSEYSHVRGLETAVSVFRNFSHLIYFAEQLAIRV